jgi:hypothetical protein
MVEAAGIAGVFIVMARMDMHLMVLVVMVDVLVVVLV